MKLLVSFPVPPKSMEWRFENIFSAPNEEQTPEQINAAVKHFTANGFICEILAPEMIAHEEILSVRQRLTLRIPNDASIPQDAVYQMDSNSNEIFSVHNILLKWRDAHEKTVPAKVENKAKHTAWELLLRISNELLFVAKKNPMVKRLAIDMDLLDNETQHKVLQRLMTVFSVTTSFPFVEKGFCKRTFLIDLP